MATEKQIAANRANAQHSTGPRTAEGKAVVARNALKHGLRAQTSILPDEDAAAFDALGDSLIDDLAPNGALEMALVERMAVLLWRVARASRRESAAMAYQRALGLHAAATKLARAARPVAPDWNEETAQADRDKYWADWPPPEADPREVERGFRYKHEVARHAQLCADRDKARHDLRTPAMLGMTCAPRRCSAPVPSMRC